MRVTASLPVTRDALFGSAQVRRAQGGEPAQDWGRIVEKEVSKRERAVESQHKEGMESIGQGACTVRIEGEEKGEERRCREEGRKRKRRSCRESTKRRDGELGSRCQRLPSLGGEGRKRRASRCPARSPLGVRW
eukprot:3586049-Rhodomonas_salina.2